MLVNVRSRLLNNTLPLIKNGIQKYTVPATTSNESNEIEYPEILDISKLAETHRQNRVWHDKIKSIKTVEEKLFEINMPRYYGWKCLDLTEHNILYNSLEMAQSYTRTAVMSKSELPNLYDSIVSTEHLDDLVNRIRPQIQDALVFEYQNRKRDHELTEDELETGKKKIILANSVSCHVNRIILSNLSSHVRHLLETQVDFNPRLESFWFAGGMDPSKDIKKERKENSSEEDYINAPCDVPVRYTGEPLLHLRHNLPLREFLPLSESEDPSNALPSFKFDPEVLGYQYDRKHATCIPGFWPGDHSEFGILSYNRMISKDRFKLYDDQDDLLAIQGMLASFAWLFSQACYQGFSTFQDVTYPFVSQMVMTDGQLWSFVAYQLNTMLMHSDNTDKNPRRNFCWVTKSIPLFESIENSQVHGFNDEVLKTLIKFYLNEPKKREGVVNMKPYLGESEKLVADIEENERRIWLESQYKHLVSNRPRHRLPPEVFAWERIYMPQNLRIPLYWRKWYEYRLKGVYERRLDDHKRLYIPRSHRDPRPSMKQKGRRAKTYYP